MRMQYLCHLSSMLLATSSALAADPAQVKLPTYNYPTLARIEYVNNCMARTADKLAGMYQCACAIDKIADSLKFDEFEAASTFARYSTLPGEGAGVKLAAGLRGGVFDSSCAAARPGRDITSSSAFCAATKLSTVCRVTSFRVTGENSWSTDMGAS